MRELNFGNAIREGLHQAMDRSQDVMVMGQLVDYKSGIFGTTTGLAEAFGTDRVQDFPVSEAAMTSVALGAAAAGMRPVIVHQRLDFMLYSLDAIANWLALWRFKSNGKAGAPVVIRAIVGKGWGQGPQHSKSLHNWFAHLPGLKVAVPSNAFDVKGLLLESIFGEDPCIIIEHRGLFSMKSPVPEAMYRVRYGEAAVRRKGKDITIVGVGAMVPSALRAAQLLSKEGIDAEVIDLRSISPLDTTTVKESVSKTRRLVVADPAWRFAGFAGEVIASVTEELGDKLLSNPIRVCYPDSHTPMSKTLEEAYYPNSETLMEEIRPLFKR
jgi:pyruvate/2-oxoglutarate/acetoin dehydrogenase E1 component